MNWNEVMACKHEQVTEHSASGGCQVCDGWDEWHCRDCGAFVKECDCGCNNGLSGWSSRRWKCREKVAALGHVLRQEAAKE
jgi:hypothetical protein